MSKLSEVRAGVLANQPTNRNFLSPLTFQFGIHKLPHTNYFVQKVNIPGLEVGLSHLSTPFKKLDIPGDHLDHEDLVLSFMVDENLRNWLEIYAWMVGLGFPHNYNQYAQLAKQKSGSGLGIRSDATLIILNSSNLPIVEVMYEDIFPYSLTGIEFSSAESDIKYVEATVKFKITTHKMRLIGSIVEVPPA